MKKILKNAKYYPDGSIAAFEINTPTGFIETKEDMERFKREMRGPT